MANKQVTDASGKAVTLTQTGSYFKNIGKMTVGADGTITTELIDTYEGLDAAVAATASNWISAVDDMLGEEIAVGDTKFYINVPPPASAASAPARPTSATSWPTASTPTSTRSRSSTVMSPL